jgi:hypothetical protein
VQFEALCKRGCFHGLIEAKEAERRLGNKKKRKKFLLRMSARDPTCLTISRRVPTFPPPTNYEQSSWAHSHSLCWVGIFAAQGRVQAHAGAADCPWLECAGGQGHALLRHPRPIPGLASRPKVWQECVSPAHTDTHAHDRTRGTLHTLCAHDTHAH